MALLVRLAVVLALVCLAAGASSYAPAPTETVEVTKPVVESWTAMRARQRREAAEALEKKNSTPTGPLTEKTERTYGLSPQSAEEFWDCSSPVSEEKLAPEHKGNKTLGTWTSAPNSSAGSPVKLIRMVSTESDGVWSPTPGSMSSPLMMRTERTRSTDAYPVFASESNGPSTDEYECGEVAFYEEEEEREPTRAEKIRDAKFIVHLRGIVHTKSAPDLRELQLEREATKARLEYEQMVAAEREMRAAKAAAERREREERAAVEREERATATARANVIAKQASRKEGAKMVWKEAAQLGAKREAAPSQAK